MMMTNRIIRAESLFTWLCVLTLQTFSCSSSIREDRVGKTLMAEDIIRLIKEGKPAIIKDCKIEGDLDFTSLGPKIPLSPNVMQVRIASPIYFEGCHFTGSIKGVDLTGETPVTSYFAEPVSFHHCQVDGLVDFSGAFFANQFNLTKSYFEKAVTMQAIRVSGDLRFEEAVFNEDFLMQEAIVWGTVWGKDATLLGQFSVQQSDFWQHVVLTGVSVHGYTDMSLVNFRRAAFFGYGKYYERVVYNGARFSDRAEWTNAIYTRTMTLDAVRFADTTELTGLDVQEGLSLIGTRFEQGRPETTRINILQR